MGISKGLLKTIIPVSAVIVVVVLSVIVSRYWSSNKNELYFASNSQVITEQLTSDVTGDGKPEHLYITIGKGCASCHQNWIYVLSEGKRLFEMTGDDAKIFALPNGTGFIIKQPVRKKNEGMCCPTEFTTDTYLWNDKQEKFVKQ